MTFDTTLPYKDGKACFRIDQDGDGIYTAQLVGWDGKATNDLPKKITLIKVVRCWSGSSDDEVLVNEIGRCIDLHQFKKQNRALKNTG